MPHASVASQLLVITLEHELPVVVVLNKFTVAPLHASLAVGGVNTGAAVHSMVALLPAAPMVGAVVSLTVIVCVLVAE